jgi:hypothetical protein
MKILRALVLGFLLVMATPAVPQQPEPKPAIEYNIGNCGAQHFTIVHVTLNADKTKLTFGVFLKSPTEVKTDVDPLVFDYAEEKPDEDGDIQFQGKAKLEGADLELDGYTRGNRIVAILLVDKKLGHVLYGYTGPVEKITDDLEPALGFCQALHVIDQNEIPNILVKWLHDGLESKPDKSDKS